MNSFSYGIIIKNIRLRANLTQNQLAKKIGISRSSISAYELEVKKPNIDTFFKICFYCHAVPYFIINNKTYSLKELKREF